VQQTYVEHTTKYVHSILFLLLLIESLVIVHYMAPTWDEPSHLSYAANILKGHPERDRSTFNSKMPVSVLNIVPRILGTQLRILPIPQSWPQFLTSLPAARYPSLLALLLLAWLVHHWSAVLYGEQAGTAALLLCMASPNLLAHGTLATTDIYFALATVATLYTHWRFVNEPSLHSGVRAAITLGVSLLTKFAALYLYLALPLVTLLLWITRKPSSKIRLARIYGCYWIALIVTTLVALNVGFVFHNSFLSLNRYRFTEAPFQRLQSMPVLRSIPVPVPEPFLIGLDMMLHDEQTGNALPNLYLLGETRNLEAKGTSAFPYYYLVSYVFKEPLGLQILFLASILLFCRRGAHEFMENGIFLLAPVLFFLVVFSFINRAQIGIRHVLPLFPLCVVMASGNFADWKSRKRTAQLLLVAPVIWAFISVGTYYPHVIPYMNELAGERQFRYRILADSNLDWGQNRWVVERYLKDNPDVVLNPLSPQRGRVLINANLLVGVFEPERYRHLRETLKPLAHVGYAHFLYQIPDQW
jgi:4-amino-4-deoxy-L-arabinose transferase-like glycosyltransferase